MLQKKNESLSEEVLELQTRSMKDNLLFFWVLTNAVHLKTGCRKDVQKKIHNFSEKELGIPNAKGQFKTDRAHRIGKFMHGKSDLFLNSIISSIWHTDVLFC